MHLKPVFAAAAVAVAVFTLTACGVESADGSASADTAADPLAAVAPKEPIIHEHSGRGVDLAAFPSRAVEPKTGIDVRLKGALAGTDGARVRVSIGLMACGYMEFGKAETTLANGQLDVTVPNLEQSYGGQAFVFVDNDHDGSCDVDAGDQVFEGTVALTGGDVSLNTSELAPTESWSCFVFNSAF